MYRTITIERAVLGVSLDLDELRDVLEMAKESVKASLHDRGEIVALITASADNHTFESDSADRFFSERDTLPDSLASVTTYVGSDASKYKGNNITIKLRRREAMVTVFSEGNPSWADAASRSFIHKLNSLRTWYGYPGIRTSLYALAWLVSMLGFYAAAGIAIVTIVRHLGFRGWVSTLGCVLLLCVAGALVLTDKFDRALPCARVIVRRRRQLINPSLVVILVSILLAIVPLLWRT
jgi:hypothetical protein